MSAARRAPRRPLARPFDAIAMHERRALAAPGRDALRHQNPRFRRSSRASNRRTAWRRASARITPCPSHSSAEHSATICLRQHVPSGATGMLSTSSRPACTAAQQGPCTRPARRASTETISRPASRSGCDRSDRRAARTSRCCAANRLGTPARPDQCRCPARAKPSRPVPSTSLRAAAAPRALAGLWTSCRDARPRSRRPTRSASKCAQSFRKPPRVHEQQRRAPLLHVLRDLIEHLAQLLVRRHRIELAPRQLRSPKSKWRPGARRRRPCSARRRSRRGARVARPPASAPHAPAVVASPKAQSAAAAPSLRALAVPTSTPGASRACRAPPRESRRRSRCAPCARSRGFFPPLPASTATRAS